MLASADQARRVERYYRWLDRLAFYAERRAEGEVAHPVHRALRDPAGRAPPSPRVIHDLLAAAVEPPSRPVRALDAGCGYGATMADLAPRLGGDWVGLTLSRPQAQRGRRGVALAGLAGRVRIEVGSYDGPLPPPGRFDLIYGIESLIHSADPAATVAHLAAALEPGGCFAVVDDMPERGMPAGARERFDRFRRFWRAPVAPGAEGWRAALRGAGLEIAAERDLSPLLLARPAAETAARLAELERAWRLKRLLGLGLRAEAEMGGILLENLQAEGWVTYRMLVARKPRA